MSTLFLYGPPGVGKSTLGGKLAERTNRTHIDTDLYIQQKYRKHVDSIINCYGIEYFRELETRALMELSEDVITPKIISLGGGSLLKRENKGYIPKDAKIIVLIGEVGVLHKRILNDTSNHRPLAHNEIEFYELMNGRKEHYASFQHQVSVDNKDPHTIVDEILRIK